MVQGTNKQDKENDNETWREVLRSHYQTSETGNPPKSIDKTGNSRKSLDEHRGYCCSFPQNADQCLPTNKHCTKRRLCCVRFVSVRSWLGDMIASIACSIETCAMAQVRRFTLCCPFSCDESRTIAGRAGPASHPLGTVRQRRQSKKGALNPNSFPVNPQTLMLVGLHCWQIMQLTLSGVSSRTSGFSRYVALMSFL